MGPTAFRAIRSSNINDEDDQSQPISERRMPLPDDAVREAEGTNDTSASSVSNTETALVVRPNDDSEEEEIEREFGIEELDVITPYLELSLLQRRTIQFATIVLDAEEKEADVDATNMRNNNGASNDHLPDDVQDGSRGRTLLSPGVPGSHLQAGSIHGNVTYNVVGSESRPVSEQRNASSPDLATTGTLADDASLAPTKEVKVDYGLQPLAYGPGDVLKFTDSRGRTFDLSFHECRTWKVSRS
jgi:hypothetical protein